MIGLTLNCRHVYTYRHIWLHHHNTKNVHHGRQMIWLSVKVDKLQIIFEEMVTNWNHVGRCRMSSTLLSEYQWPSISEIVQKMPTVNLMACVMRWNSFQSQLNRVKHENSYRIFTLNEMKWNDIPISYRNWLHRKHAIAGACNLYGHFRNGIAIFCYVNQCESSQFFENFNFQCGSGQLLSTRIYRKFQVVHLFFLFTFNSF